MSEPPHDVVLPCGCYVTHRVEGGERLMRIVPCKLDCVNLSTALKIADAKGKPVMMRMGP